MFVWVVLLPCCQVTEDDVRSAYRLWFDALSGSAADEEGQLDMNVLTGGTSAKHQHFIANELPHLLRSILSGRSLGTSRGLCVPSVGCLCHSLHVCACKVRASSCSYVCGPY